jgi:hypothetical protein
VIGLRQRRIDPHRQAPRALCLVAAWTGVACGSGGGGGAGGGAEEHAASEVSLEARAADDDVVVAQVDGKPVYGSCVAAQLRGGAAADRAAALAQCVDFELLAQEAARRGLAADGEVHEARQRETVRRFIDAEYAAAVRSFDDLPAELGAAPLARAHQLADHPEFREAVYVRAPALDAPSGSPDDVWARGLAEEIHAGLADRTELTADEFREIADRIAHGRHLEIGKPFAFPRHGRAVEEFAAATFAIPAVGMASAPTRTRWGWDVILLTKLSPESKNTDEELEAALFPELRRAYFTVWAQQFARGVPIEVAEEWLPRLVAADEAQGRADEAQRP